jgi:hypothetical protein
MTSSALTILHLKFEPAHPNQQPPKTIIVKLQLEGTLFYAIEPWKDFPNTSKSQDFLLTSGQAKSLNITLSTYRLTGLKWDNIDDGTLTTSLFSDQKRPLWTTTLSIPVTLPNRSCYGPTFHSCLVSQSYVLHCNIHCSISGPTVIGGHIPSLYIVDISLAYPRRRSSSTELPKEDAYTTSALPPGTLHHDERGSRHSSCALDLGPAKILPKYSDRIASSCNKVSKWSEPIPTFMIL